ncbi:MAG: DUF3592 domain-containing protein [Planctomycetia bacterium]|nr:DUF3592 domain-containing protein [Planctomycetia bacterium]
MAFFERLGIDGWFLVRCVVMLAGLALVYYAVRGMWRRRAIRRDPVRAFGKVLALEREPGDEGPDWYTPTVRYRDEHEVVHEAKLMIVKDTETYAVGKRVPIVYERGNPKNLIGPSDGWAETIAHLLILAMGTVLFAFGAVAEVVAVKP